ncbi:MAG: ATP-binding protein [Chloroflexota bacterium]
MSGATVVISGAHGTGKTTAAYILAGKIKMLAAVDVRVRTELARECPFTICQNRGGVERRAEADAQWWIFAKQVLRDLDTTRRADRQVIIYDRGLIDVIGYSAALGYHEIAYAMMQIAKTINLKRFYDYVIFKPIAEFPLIDDGCRSLDQEFRQEVEHAILSAWDEVGIKFETEAEVLRAIGGNDGMRSM